MKVIYHIAIVVYALLLLGLAAASVGIGGMDIRGAVYLRGPVELQPGETHGFRGVLHYAPTGEALMPESVHMRLVGPGLAVPLEVGGEWPDLLVTVPEETAPGERQLEVRLESERTGTVEAAAEVRVGEGSVVGALEEREFPEGRTRHEDAHRRRPQVQVMPRPIEIEVDFTAPEEEGALEDEGSEEAEEGDEEAEGPQIALDLIPADGELVRGLEQRIFLRVVEVETGAPVRADLSLEKTMGIIEGELPEVIRSDGMGIAVVELVASTDLDIEVDVHPRDEELLGERFLLRLSSVPTQFVVRPTALVVGAGQDLSAQVMSTLASPNFMADLYDGPHLLGALTLSMREGQGGVVFDEDLLVGRGPLLRLQVYQSLYGTSHGWDSAYVFLAPRSEPEDLQGIAEELVAYLGEHGDNPYHRWLVEEGRFDEELDVVLVRRLIAASLAEMPRSFELPPVLLNTRQEDRETLATWQEEARRELQWLIGFLLLGGFAVVLYFVLLGVRRHQEEARMLKEIELDLEPNSADEHRAIALDRLTVVVQAVVVLATLAAFALGILLVVSYL